MKDILSLLAQDSYFIVNKDLAKVIGINEAIILGELASEYTYYLKNDKLTEDGYFYSTVKNIEDNTTIKRDKQRKILNHLQDLDLIDIKFKETPAKRFIKLNKNNIFKLFES